MKTKREIIFELANQGKTCKEIKELTGISLPTIYQYKAEYNKVAAKKRVVVKGANKNRTLCKTCIYRARDFSVNRCDYIDIEKHSRGCFVEDCDKYIKGPRAPRKNDIAYSDKEPSWKK